MWLCIYSRWVLYTKVTYSMLVAWSTLELHSLAGVIQSRRAWYPFARSRRNEGMFFISASFNLCLSRTSLVISRQITVFISVTTFTICHSFSNSLHTKNTPFPQNIPTTPGRTSRLLGPLSACLFQFFSTLYSLLVSHLFCYYIFYSPIFLSFSIYIG